MTHSHRLQKISKVLDSETEPPGTLELQNTQKGVSIQFQQVSFGYADRNVLQNVSVHILHNQLVCISGISGSGKSTFLRLLTGAFRTFEGNILVENAPLFNYNLKSLRSQTGILLSQQDIFHGTLLENLTMSGNDVSIAEISTMIEKLKLKNFVQSHKNGYDTILDVQGRNLSKKIRQEILLVRALLGNHRLLLLENPFNYLDEEETDAVLSYLRNDKNSTIIITSDNPAIQQKCDTHIVLANGFVSN